MYYQNTFSKDIDLFQYLSFYTRSCLIINSLFVFHQFWNFSTIFPMLYLEKEYLPHNFVWGMHYYTNKKGVFYVKKISTLTSGFRQVGPLISKEALSVTHVMNDKVWDSHEVYQIHQKYQCGSEGIGRLSCLKLAPFLFLRGFGAWFLVKSWPPHTWVYSDF